MGYGLTVWDVNGYVQFNSEDPAIFAQGQTLATPIYDSQEAGTYRTADITAIAENDLTIAKPASSGSIGMLRWGTNVFFYSGEGFTVAGGLSQLGNFANDITWQDIDDASNLTCGPGYGLCIWDALGNLTFSSTGGSWANIVNITPSGSPTINGQRLLYTAPNLATFDRCYGIMNGHQYRWFAEYDILLENEKIEMHHRGYYFDRNNLKIYGCDFNYSDPTFRLAGSDLNPAHFSSSGVLENDFYVVII